MWNKLALTRPSYFSVTIMRNVVRRYHRLLGARTWPRPWPINHLRCLISWPQHSPWLENGTAVPIRGAKSKTTVKFDDLPQGALEPMLDTAEDEDKGPTYPTVVRQARNNMRKFDNCVVLTRVGSFYEV